MKYKNQYFELALLILFLSNCNSGQVKKDNYTDCLEIKKVDSSMYLFLTFWSGMTESQYKKEVDNLVRQKVLNRDSVAIYKIHFSFIDKNNMANREANLKLIPQFKDCRLYMLHLSLLNTNNLHTVDENNKEVYLQDSFDARRILQIFTDKYDNPFIQKDTCNLNSKSWSKYYYWEYNNKSITIRESYWGKGLDPFCLLIKKPKSELATEGLTSFVITYCEKKIHEEIKAQRDSIKSQHRRDEINTIKEQNNAALKSKNQI